MPKRTRTQSAVKCLPLSQRPMEEIWSEYHKTGSDTLRNFLMEKYLKLVHDTAKRVHSKLPGEVDVEDLKQAGAFGLKDAIDSFDPGRKVKFETFSAPRIRGAILDELRSMDWVPRLVRARTARFDRARKQLHGELGRPPTTPEIADRMGLSMDEFEKVEKDSGPTAVVSLNRKWYQTDSNKDVREIDVVRDRRLESPQIAAQKRDLRDAITKGLTRAERLIVVLYYYEQMTMKEIGITLDLSESRVSQMHSSILARLKAQMHRRDTEFAHEED